MEVAFRTYYLREEKQLKKTDKVDDDKMPHLLTNQGYLILYHHNLETHHKWKKFQRVSNNILIFIQHP